jgi:leucyl-tRNA synthetase
LDKIGFCYDWEREVQTSDPKFYKWTQWIFLQLYNSYFCNTEKKALPISKLIEKYFTKGAMPKTGEPIPGTHFTASEWNSYSKHQQEEILMKRRLAFSAYGEVNWCEALGTVLANDEVINGVSERGGHHVLKKTLRQWYLRITESWWSSPSSKTFWMWSLMVRTSFWNNSAICFWVSQTVSPAKRTSTRVMPSSVW